MVISKNVFGVGFFPSFPDIQKKSLLNPLEILRHFFLYVNPHDPLPVSLLPTLWSGTPSSHSIVHLLLSFDSIFLESGIHVPER